MARNPTAYTRPVLYDATTRANQQSPYVQAQVPGSQIPSPQVPVQQVADPMRDPWAAVEKYYPEYQGYTDEAGNLRSQYQIQAPEAYSPRQLYIGQLDTDKLAADKRALDYMRDRSMAAGDSPWAQQMLNRQAMDESQSKSLLGMASRGQTAQAMGDLAMRGGLSSGARERMARQGATDYRSGWMDLSRAGQGQRYDIRAEDDARKMAMLQQIPGYDLQYADYTSGLDKYNIDKLAEQGKFNITNEMAAADANRQMQMEAAIRNQNALLGSQDSLNQFNINRYGERMKALAGLSAADAYRQAGNSTPGGGGGGMISSKGVLGVPWREAYKYLPGYPGSEYTGTKKVLDYFS